ncbi:MAG: ABC transporter ATP-binding protein [Hydrogenophaga sp.]|uniref:ABC transporter ATP-binding protein n=1 Tax=Hydrogenophaga sp. TaxID=1904254 RepID=UPI003D1225DD
MNNAQQPALVADRLTRRFGERVAVDQVSFTVQRGEIFGFLGPNGAGKSTTARMLTGFLPPTDGHAWVAGIDVSRYPSAARRHIGVVPEEANVYADLTVRQNVLLMAELHGVARAERERRCDELLQTFDLSARAGQKGRELSKGLRQRLMLCMALVSAPQTLFLDEPTSGLDVASTHMIREVIARLNRDMGMTVFITTHNMEEADQLCHRVAIIDRGRLAAIDTPVALRGRVESRRSVAVKFAGRVAAPEELLPQHGMEVESMVDGWRVFNAEPGPLAQHIATRSTELGLKLASLNTLTPTLEEVFVSITGDAHGQP